MGRSRRVRIRKDASAAVSSVQSLSASGLTESRYGSMNFGPFTACAGVGQLATSAPAGGSGRHRGEARQERTPVDTDILRCLLGDFTIRIDRLRVRRHVNLLRRSRQ
jgi:hypothetical protein